MKKLISLVLALTMVLSMSAMSVSATELIQVRFLAGVQAIVDGEDVVFGLEGVQFVLYRHGEEIATLVTDRYGSASTYIPYPDEEVTLRVITVEGWVLDSDSCELTFVPNEGELDEFFFIEVVAEEDEEEDYEEEEEYDEEEEEVVVPAPVPATPVTPAVPVAPVTAPQPVEAPAADGFPFSLFTFFTWSK